MALIRFRIWIRSTPPGTPAGVWNRSSRQPGGSVLAVRPCAFPSGQISSRTEREWLHCRAARRRSEALRVTGQGQNAHYKRGVRRETPADSMVTIDASRPIGDSPARFNCPENLIWPTQCPPFRLAC